MVLNVKISFYNKEFTKRNGIQVLIDDLEFFVPTNAFNLARLSNGKLMEKKINKYNKAPQHNKESAKREAIRTCINLTKPSIISFVPTCGYVFYLFKT